MATLLVCLTNPDSGAVLWKPKGIKGARQRQARSIYEACRMADEVMPAATPDQPRDIELVEQMP